MEGSHMGEARNQEWSWLRVYYFEECKDVLILDGVWPAVQAASLGEPESQAYFQRDWLGGPNVLVGLHHACSRSTELQVADQVREYLKAHPAKRQFSARHLSQLTQSLARWEGKPGATSVFLQPNNCVLVESKEPFSLFLRQDLLKEAVREFLSVSSELALRWLGLIRAGAQQRQYIALQLMIALAWLADPKRLRSHLSFSSHAEGFLRAGDSNGQLKRAFLDRYEGRQGETMRQVLKTSVEALQSENGPIPHMKDFVALLRHTLSDLYQGLREDRYQATPATEFVGGAFNDPAAFNRMVEIMDHSPAWRAWQITISLLYQTLNQLGIKPIERFLACYLLSRSAEDVYGEPVGRIMEELERGGEHTVIFSFFAELDQSMGGNPRTTCFQNRVTI